MAATRVELEELAVLLEERARRQEAARYRRMFPGLYDWQKEFVAASARYSQCALIAANRIGKTYLGTYIDAIHALGDYPEDWEGHRFDHAPLIWCLGYSGEKTRDLLQLPLIGRKTGNKFAGGLIPADHIKDYESMAGTTNALRTLHIRQVGGGDVQAPDATIQFWSYSQGQHALMGDGVDWFHVDEEPKDANIYPQVLTRTATGDRNRGGRGILTLTPENGRTELVIQFKDTPSRAQFCMQKGWDDAPHLNEQVKEDLLASYPKHQREMRTKGTPMLGHGRIFDIAEEDVTCAPFAIPKHFRVIDGMDFGFDHPQAQVQIVMDTDAEMFYATKAWKKREVSPSTAWGAVKSWAAGVPTAWPADGLQREKGSGKQQKAYYTEAGFNLLGVHATWPDGSNSVEAGLFEIRDLMLAGKFKIFAGLRDLLDEFLEYHRDDLGAIVKKSDDALDAMRYAYMMRRLAIAYGEVGKPKTFEDAEPLPMVSHYGRNR